MRMDRSKEQLENKKEKLVVKRRWLASLIGVHELGNGRTTEWVSMKAIFYLYCIHFYFLFILSAVFIYLMGKTILSIEILGQTIQHVIFAIFLVVILLCLLSPVIFCFTKMMKVITVYSEISFLITQTDEQIKQLEKQLQKVE